MIDKVIDLCGLNEETPTRDIIKSNINTGIKQFQGRNNHHWTRREKHTDLNTGQADYQMPADMLRIITVKAKQSNNSDIVYPLIEITSENEWNRLTSFPMSATWAQYFFVKGHDVISIFPEPSQDLTDGLIVSYEPYIADFQLEDIELTADFIQNDVNVENPSEPFIPYMINNCYLQTTDGGDGSWYRINEVITGNHLRLENVFEGFSGLGIPCIIGQKPPVPEEFHGAFVNYACYKFFMMRKDVESATLYKRMFDDDLEKYVSRYAKKTTSSVGSAVPIAPPTVADVFRMSTLTEN
jgi:hypothetical protein